MTHQTLSFRFIPEENEILTVLITATSRIVPCGVKAMQREVPHSFLHPYCKDYINMQCLVKRF